MRETKGCYGRPQRVRGWVERRGEQNRGDSRILSRYLCVIRKAASESLPVLPPQTMYPDLEPWAPESRASSLPLSKHGVLPEGSFPGFPQEVKLITSVILNNYSQRRILFSLEEQTLHWVSLMCKALPWGIFLSLFMTASGTERRTQLSGRL